MRNFFKKRKKYDQDSNAPIEKIKYFDLPNQKYEIIEKIGFLQKMYYDDFDTFQEIASLSMTFME